MASFIRSHGTSFFNVRFSCFFKKHFNTFFKKVAIAVRYTNFGMTDDIVTDEITLLDYVFAGMWAGILYGVAGLFGMCGSYERNRCKYIIINKNKFKSD